MPGFIAKYAEDPKNEILLISFQAEGTLGRKIQERREQVIINDRKVKLKALIEEIHSFSSHADSVKLKKWINTVNPKKLFIVHGEEEQSILLKQSLEIKDITIPKLEEKYEIWYNISIIN